VADGAVPSRDVRPDRLPARDIGLASR
jgi:hypothetical protein